MTRLLDRIKPNHVDEVPSFRLICGIVVVDIVTCSLSSRHQLAGECVILANVLRPNLILPHFVRLVH